MRTMKKNALLSGGSIARRVSLTGGIGLAVVLLGICGVMSAIALARADDTNAARFGERAQALAQMAAGFDESSHQMTAKLFRSFANDLSGDFVLEPNGDLSLYGDKLNGNFGAVDKFSKQTGGVATIFAAKGDDFVRVTTSLKKENGERAMGTMLGKASPAYAAVMAGKPFVGPASLFGKPYMTRYEPVKDASGKIVGLLFIGFDESPYRATLQKLSADIHIAGTGGLMIIDPEDGPADAVFVTHPTAAGKKVLDVKAGASALLAALNGFDGTHRLPSAGLIADASDTWVVGSKVAANGWWVLAEVSQAKAIAPTYATLVPFWVLLGGATLALGAGLFWMMRRWVATPLGQLGGAIEAVAGGDLTVAVHSERVDEVGQLMRGVEAMRLRLAAMLATVRQSVESINTASSEIAHGNVDLSQRTETTASNLQQTASSIEQLSGTVRQSADAAAQANQLASSASSVALRGGEVVSQVVSTMSEINSSSKKIADIIGTIDGIAFQTNILALNAAVEAARAGEQGRGFAVVASEVRSLAQRSADAAKEIKALIGNSVDKVESGSRLVADAGSTMTEIVASVQRVTDIMGEISAASSEQREGIVSVNDAVTELDRMTQQNAALVEESAAAAESLREQAARLSSVVATFRIGSDAVAATVAENPAEPGEPAEPAGPAAPVAASAVTVAAGVVTPRPAELAESVIAQAREATRPAALPDGDWASF